MSLSWSTNLRNRLLTGFIGGPLLLASAIYGRLPFLIIITAILLLSLYEMQIMGRTLGYGRLNITGFIFAILVLADNYYFNALHVYLIVVMYLTAIILSALFKDKAYALSELSYRCVSTFYVTLFLSPVILIREFPFVSGYLTAGKIISVIFLGVWFLDTFAYFSGRMFGKHPLFPRISPKKTIEGSIGGMLGAIGVMAAAHYIYLPELSLFHTIIIGLIIGVLGQIGDLIESFFKRKTGVKDSSNILPGHGGIFDRFDSLVFVCPFIYFYIKWMIPT